VKNIRGKGLMIGIELDTEAFDIVPLGLENGILLNIVANKVIRLLPPLIITQTEVDEMIKRLAKTVQKKFS